MRMRDITLCRLLKVFKGFQRKILPPSCRLKRKPRGRWNQNTASRNEGGAMFLLNKGRLSPDRRTTQCYTPNDRILKVV
jgi:hypothetical protein